MRYLILSLALLVSGCASQPALMCGDVPCDLGGK